MRSVGAKMAQPCGVAQSCLTVSRWPARTCCVRACPSHLQSPACHPMRLRQLRLPLAALLAAGLPSVMRAQAEAVSADSAAAAAARQVAVGEQWFRSACLECHAARGLDNADFRLKWAGRSALDLFELIRSTMPDGKAGSLTPGTYAAIVSYLMRANGMPVGARRLSSDSSALMSIRLTFPAKSAPTNR